MKYFWLLAALFATQAHAYTGDEMRGDCLAAEDFYALKKNSDPFQSIRSARCIAYVAGFADGYAVSDYLAEKVGVKLNAFCLPNESDLSPRLVRSVLAHLDRTPPNSTLSTAMLVASALAKSFPCAETLEPKK
ncbi:MAG: Rap1a/Tai family immunity protein [Azonexus sp.]|nr:Rap1a/Tai family immunity protein [Azonexus sp.]